jgi:hypothetical protein
LICAPTESQTPFVFDALLEKYFPTALYHQSSAFTTLMEEAMARLQDGEKQEVAEHIHRIVRSRYLGLRETEIAQMARMDRRRLNNYLRELEGSNKIFREGRLWFAK